VVSKPRLGWGKFQITLVGSAEVSGIFSTVYVQQLQADEKSSYTNEY